VRVRASRGSSLEDVEARAEQLAVCLQAREVRVVRDRDNAATGTVTLVRRDPLAGMVSLPWPPRDAEALSLWEPVPVGVDELGDTVTVALPERNVLMGGEPGAGKSARCRCWSRPRRLIRARGCGCSTASWSSCRRGRRARNASPARTSARRSTCCASCAR
jgi:hypothetical protein